MRLFNTSLLAGLFAILLVVTTGVAATPAKENKPRIIALAPHIVEMLYSFGAGQQIIATLEFADYPIAAKSIPRIGNYANIQIEKVNERIFFFPAHSIHF